MSVFSVVPGVNYAKYAPLFAPPDVIGAQGRAVSVEQGMVNITSEIQRQKQSAELQPSRVRAANLANQGASLNMEIGRENLLQSRESHLADMEKIARDIEFEAEDREFMKFKRNALNIKEKSRNEKVLLDQQLAAIVDRAQTVALEKDNIYTELKTSIAGQDPRFALELLTEAQKNNRIWGLTGARNIINGIMDQDYDQRTWLRTDPVTKQVIKMTGAEIRAGVASTPGGADAFFAANEFRTGTDDDQAILQKQRIDAFKYVGFTPEAKQEAIDTENTLLQANQRWANEDKQMVIESNRIFEERVKSGKRTNYIGGVTFEAMLTEGIWTPGKATDSWLREADDRISQIAEDMDYAEPNEQVILASQQRVLEAFKNRVLGKSNWKNTVFGNLSEEEAKKANDIRSDLHEVMSEFNGRSDMPKIDADTAVERTHNLFDAMYDDKRTDTEKWLRVNEMRVKHAERRSRGPAGLSEVFAEGPRERRASANAVGVTSYASEAEARAAGFIDGQVVTINGVTGTLTTDTPVEE